MQILASADARAATKEIPLTSRKRPRPFFLPRRSADRFKKKRELPIAANCNKKRASDKIKYGSIYSLCLLMDAIKSV